MNDPKFSLRLWFAALLLFLAATANGEKIALVSGTIVNPANARVESATVLIENGRITEVDPKAVPSAQARLIDCKGKFILPGYIDTHVHFFQSGDLFTRPDGVDLNKIRPYKDEIAWIKKNLPDTFARYLRCGITSVVDVGGPMWNFEVRKIASATEKAPRVAVAGPLISSVSRPQLDLGDPPIVKIDTPEQAREFVRKLAAQNPDYIKIWYIVGQGSSGRKFPPDRARDIEESHAHKIRVAVHATELETARAAVEEGADLLVHSVTDKPVDDAFVRLLKEKGTILTPTLVVFERYGRTFANKLNLTPEEKAWGNPEVIASLDVTKIPADQLPERIKTAMANPDAALDRIKQLYDSRVEKFEDARGRRRHHCRRHRCRKYRHDSRPRALPRVPAHERSWPNEDADPAMHDRERRQTFRRRNRLAHRLDRERQLRRSRHPELESGRRHRARLRHRHRDQERRRLSRRQHPEVGLHD